MIKYLNTKKASEMLDVHPNTLRNWAEAGKIEYIRTKTGHRRYNVESYIGEQRMPSVVCYCRVSSTKQRDDLERQVQYMQSLYPEAEVVKDIGSGLNFKRKGLGSVLERAMSGDKLTLVVAHRDRLCRFGFELVRNIIERTGGEVVVLNETSLSPEQELVADLLSIIHVFGARLHGLRSYKNKIRSDVSKQEAETNSSSLVRSESGDV